MQQHTERYSPRRLLEDQDEIEKKYDDEDEAVGTKQINAPFHYFVHDGKETYEGSKKDVKKTSFLRSEPPMVR
jgi:hypothetical protein